MPIGDAEMRTTMWGHADTMASILQQMEREQITDAGLQIRPYEGRVCH
jgi:hypothetical protein